MGRARLGPGATEAVTEQPPIPKMEPQIVERVVYVDKPVEVIKEVFIDNIVEKLVEVPVEVIKYVDKPYEVVVEKSVTVEKIIYIDKPFETIKEVMVDKLIETKVYMVPKWAYVVMAMEAAAIFASFLI